MFTSLRDDAQNFATNTIGASFAISHQTLGCGHNCDTQTIHNLWNIFATLVYTQTRTTYALNLFNYRTISIILQADFQCWLAFVS